MRLIPRKKEVETWLLFTLKHSNHVEYFLNKFGLGSSDPERPHDIIGIGNKYDIQVASGFALQYREPKVDFKIYIAPALALHRQQYHHRMWNQPHPLASQDDLLVGAIDAVCSQLESRDYQGGSHSYEEILEIMQKSHSRQTDAANIMILEMKKIPQPNLEQITSLAGFPNMGLPSETYDRIVKLTLEAQKLIKEFA